MNNTREARLGFRGTREVFPGGVTTNPRPNTLGQVQQVTGVLQGRAGNPTQAGAAPQLPGLTGVTEQPSHAREFNQQELADPRGTNFPTQVLQKASNLESEQTLGLPARPMQTPAVNVGGPEGLGGFTPGELAAAGHIDRNLNPEVAADAVAGLNRLEESRRNGSLLQGRLQEAQRHQRGA
jgi:hypothetical protein